MPIKYIINRDESIKESQKDSINIQKLNNENAKEKINNFIKEYIKYINQDNFYQWYEYDLKLNEKDRLIIQKDKFTESDLRYNSIYCKMCRRYIINAKNHAEEHLMNTYNIPEPINSDVKFITDELKRIKKILDDYDRDLIYIRPTVIKYLNEKRLNEYNKKIDILFKKLISIKDDPIKYEKVNEENKSIIENMIEYKFNWDMVLNNLKDEITERYDNYRKVYHALRPIFRIHEPDQLVYFKIHDYMKSLSQVLNENQYDLKTLNYRQLNLTLYGNLNKFIDTVININNKYNLDYMIFEIDKDYLNVFTIIVERSVLIKYPKTYKFIVEKNENKIVYKQFNEDHHIETELLYLPK